MIERPTHEMYLDLRRMRTAGETSTERYHALSVEYHEAIRREIRAERAADPLHSCPRCEGDGSYSELATCTTFGPDCACNGPRVIVDPCPDCEGSGYVNA